MSLSSRAALRVWGRRRWVAAGVRLRSFVCRATRCRFLRRFTCMWRARWRLCRVWLCPSAARPFRALSLRGRGWGGSRRRVRLSSFRFVSSTRPGRVRRSPGWGGRRGRRARGRGPLGGAGAPVGVEVASGGVVGAGAGHWRGGAGAWRGRGWRGAGRRGAGGLIGASPGTGPLAPHSEAIPRSRTRRRGFLTCDPLFAGVAIMKGNER